MTSASSIQAVIRTVPPHGRIEILPGLWHKGRRMSDVVIYPSQAKMAMLAFVSQAFGFSGFAKPSFESRLKCPCGQSSSCPVSALP